MSRCNPLMQVLRNMYNSIKKEKKKKGNPIFTITLLTKGLITNKNIDRNNIMKIKV